MKKFKKQISYMLVFTLILFILQLPVSAANENVYAETKVDLTSGAVQKLDLWSDPTRYNQITGENKTKNVDITVTCRAEDVTSGNAVPGVLSSQTAFFDGFGMSPDFSGKNGGNGIAVDDSGFERVTPISGTGYYKLTDFGVSGWGNRWGIIHESKDEDITIEFSFDTERTFNEFHFTGFRANLEQYSMQYYDGQSWLPVQNGTGTVSYINSADADSTLMGYYSKIKFSEVTTQRFRFIINSTLNTKIVSFLEMEFWNRKEKNVNVSVSALDSDGNVVDNTSGYTGTTTLSADTAFFDGIGMVDKKLQGQSVGWANRWGTVSSTVYYPITITLNFNELQTFNRIAMTTVRKNLKDYELRYLDGNGEWRPVPYGEGMLYPETSEKDYTKGYYGEMNFAAVTTKGLEIKFTNGYNNSIVSISEIELWNIYEGNIKQISNSDVADYITQARILYSDENASSIVKNYNIHANQDRPKGVILQWDYNADKLELSLDNNFKTILKTYELSGNTCKLNNLMSDTEYYWRTSLNGVVKENGNFKTTNTVRLIYADDVRNVRDIGGWNGLNQGLVYRGREMNSSASEQTYSLSAGGKAVMKNDLGIKTDLDLRAENRYGNITESPLGADVQWKKFPIGQYSAIFSSNNKELLRQTLEVFAEKDNYPIYIHCIWGADRTGTLAFILEGLCGVSEEDLCIDYELTTFSDLARTKDGDFDTMLKTIKNNYAGNTLQEKFENFVISELGLTEIQVKNIQSILAGDGSVVEKGITANIMTDATKFLYGQEINITATIANNTSKDTTAVLIAAMYKDESNKLEFLSCTDTEVIKVEKGTQQNLSLNISVDNRDVTCIKFFLWDGYTNIVPYVESVTVYRGIN